MNDFYAFNFTMQFKSFQWKTRFTALQLGCRLVGLCFNCLLLIRISVIFFKSSAHSTNNLWIGFVISAKEKIYKCFAWDILRALTMGIGCLKREPKPHSSMLALWAKSVRLGTFIQLSDKCRITVVLQYNCATVV